MDNDELLQRLAPAGEVVEETSVAPVETARYLVFHTEGTHYALPSEAVAEIVIDAPRFFVPFVPPYIRGLINRHGEPYTVLDLSMFLEQKPLEAFTYLVLNVPGDQIAFLVSDVVEIPRVPVNEIAVSEESDGCLCGSFTLNGTEVLVLNMGTILARLKSDAGRE
jgi:purine-binding chemotaxis protein CheW